MFSQTTPMIHTLTFAQFDFGYVVGGVFLLIAFLLVGILPLAHVIATAWAGVTKLRLKAGLKRQVIALKQQMIELKQQMIERGMTADEIVQVLGPPSEALGDLSEEEDDEAGVVHEPFAGEVVVEREGEWHSALVLRRSADRCLIHTCPGYGGAVEMSGNEWVVADRVRFPAPSGGQDGSPRGSTDRTGAFDAGQWCGQPEKAPVPAEV